MFGAAGRLANKCRQSPTTVRAQLVVVAVWPEWTADSDSSQAVMPLIPLTRADTTTSTTTSTTSNTIIVLPTVRPGSVVTEVGSVSQVPEFVLVTRAHTSWTSHKYIRLSPGLNYLLLYISLGSATTLRRLLKANI